MTDIKIGPARDNSKADVTIISEDGQSKVKISGTRDEATRTVLLHDIGNRKLSQTRKSNKLMDADRHTIVTGTFYLIAFVTILSCIGTFAIRLNPAILMLVVMGSLLAIYLFALILLPKPEINGKGFLQLVTQFVKVATMRTK